MFLSHTLSKIKNKFRWMKNFQGKDYLAETIKNIYKNRSGKDHHQEWKTKNYIIKITIFFYKKYKLLYEKIFTT